MLWLGALCFCFLWVFFGGHPPDPFFKIYFYLFESCVTLADAGKNFLLQINTGTEEMLLSLSGDRVMMQ